MEIRIQSQIEEYTEMAGYVAEKAADRNTDGNNPNSSDSVISVLNRLLGNEQKERLKEHLRMENGRVPASKMMLEMGEILNSVKEGKNS